MRRKIKNIIQLFLFFLIQIYAQPNSATITGFTYTADDSTAVFDHLVRLKEAWSGQQIDSFYTNGSNAWMFNDVPTPVEDNNPGVPGKFILYQNFPNPFNPHTTIRYDLKESSPVSLKIYDIKGEKVTELVNQEQASGRHEVVWDGKNNFGQQIAEGIYIYHLNAGKFNEVKKMVYLHGSVPSTGNRSQSSENGMDKAGSQNNTQSLDYIIEIVNLENTNPQILNTEHYFTLSGDTSLNIYVQRQSPQTANLDLASLVQMMSGDVPGKYEKAELMQGGNVIQTKNTNDNGEAGFENISANQNYTIHLSGDENARPNIFPKDTTIYVVGDTAIVMKPGLYLRPTTLASLENKTFNEDEFPANPQLHDLWTKTAGYDSLGNPSDVSALMYVVTSQDNSGLAPVIIEGNQYTDLQSLKQDGNGSNKVTIRAFSPNGTYAEQSFNVVVNAMTDRKGKLVDTEGNPRTGYIYGTNANGDKVIIQTGADGNFAYQMTPAAWDSIKGQILNDVRPVDGGFIRSLYFTTNNDGNNIIVDAVPHLNGSDYIGLDTLDSFINEANFNHPVGGNVGKMKKGNLTNLLDQISSYFVLSGDTILPEEQVYIINNISQRIDPYFNIPSTKYAVPQDSTMQLPNVNAINWFKDAGGAIGSISTWDLNNDGILEGARIDLSYIIYISGQNTTYNDKAIVQEGLSARVASGEVGITSPISPDKTVLHIATSKRDLQPADIWLVNIVKHFPALTNHDDILKIGNLAGMFSGATGNNLIKVINKYTNVDNYRE